MAEPRTAVDGLRVCVVGAGSGIGAALVARLEDGGAAVAGVDLHGAAVSADIATEQGCAHAIEASVDRLGGLDGLAVTAGVTEYRPIERADAALWSRLLSVNLVGPALLTSAALAHLRASPAPSVVTVASGAGRRGANQFSVYSASKAAIIHWSRSAARELGPEGIRVNCVSPGPIDTPMLHSHRPEGADPATWVDQLASQTALGRVGTPAEVAAVIAFLLGRDAGYVSGAVLDVDGGEQA